MTRAKLFKDGGSQAVRLPKAFRFAGSEVVLRPSDSTGSLSNFDAYMRENFPNGVEFPDIERPIPDTLVSPL